MEMWNRKRDQIWVIDENKKRDIEEPLSSNNFSVDYINSKDLNEDKLKTVNLVKGIIIVNNVEIKSTIITCSLVLKIRELSNVPIWIVSNSYTSIEREVFLNIGVDGFFYQDNSNKEIELTMTNLIKRDSNTNKFQKGVEEGRPTNNLKKNLSNKKNKKKKEEEITELRQAEIIIDNQEQKVIVNEIEIRLSDKQFELAILLISNKNEVVDYETIYGTIWKDQYDSDKKVFVTGLVAQLRSQFERNQVNQKYIYNVPNKGYKFVMR